MSSNGQNIIDKILADANAEANEIKKAAMAEADEIIAQANAKAAKEAQALNKLAEEEAAKAAAKEISAAEMDAKKMILETKQACLEEVSKAAKAKLLALKGAEYENIILKMLENFPGVKDCQVILSNKDKKDLAAAVSAKGYAVADEARDFDGGFVLKKGDIEYNYSFESIIAVEKEEFEKIAAGILFA